jgi:hypothetical protein
MRKAIINSAILLLAGAIGLSAASTNGADDAAKTSAAPRLARTIPLSGVGVPNKTTDAAAIPGRLDHLAYDAATGRLFIAGLEQGSLEVVDLNKGERVKRITGLKKPQGIAVVASAGCVVVACGDENAVHVYALSDLTEQAVTPVGQNADNVRSDGTNKVYVGFGPDEGPGGLAVYDAAALKKIGEIKLSSRPESFQFDLRPDENRIFVNLPGQKRANNDGSVALVDRAEGRTLATWPLAGAARNFPMAFDADHGRVFIASRKPPELICLDSKTGSVISRAACVADSDDLYYDSKTSRVLVIGGGHRAGEPAPPGSSKPGDDAALDVFQLDEAGGLSKIASIATAPHARTGFFVPQRRAIYIVCPPQGTGDAKVLEYTVGAK